MFSTQSSIPAIDNVQYVIYATAILIVAFGIYKAQGVIAFFLDKLYEIFIQNNPSIQ